MRPWKFWLLLIALAVAGVFAAARVVRAFRDRPPAKFAQEDHTTPAVDRGSDPDLPWNHLTRLRENAEQSQAALQLKLGSIQFVELARNPSNALFWSTTKLVNPGFAPMSHFATPAPGNGATLLGFYTVAGEPLRWSIRRDPAQVSWSAVTIHLEPPAPPGATVWVWRRERRLATLSAAKPGQCAFAWSRLTPNDPEIHGRGILLPPGASLVDHQPRGGTFLSVSGVPMVSWINVNLEPDPPAPAVTYRLAK